MTKPISSPSLQASPAFNGLESLKQALYMAENRTLLEAAYKALEESKACRMALLSHKKKVGKTYLTALMALGFSQLFGKKVLVVDCSSLFPSFEQSGRLSLLSALDPQGLSLKASPLSQSKWDEVQKNLTLLPLSHLLALSSQHPAQQDTEFRQDSATMALERIKTASTNYDVTIFDTVAFEQLNRQNISPFTVSRFFEAAFFVSPQSPIQKNDSLEIEQQIQTHQIKIMGVIPNQGCV